MHEKFTAYRLRRSVLPDQKVQKFTKIKQKVHKKFTFTIFLRYNTNFEAIFNIFDLNVMYSALPCVFLVLSSIITVLLVLPENIARPHIRRSRSGSRQCARAQCGSVHWRA